MISRSIKLGWLLSTLMVGTLFSMGIRNHDEAWAALIQSPENEARALVYSQFEEDLQYFSDSISNSLRMLMIESVLGWLTYQQNPSWWRFSAFSVLTLAGLSNMLDIKEKGANFAAIIARREMAWRQILGMRQQYEAHAEILRESEVLDQDDKDEA
jgi:hypothetical protein